MSKVIAVSRSEKHTLDLLQKSVFNTALGGVPAAVPGGESTYARTLFSKSNRNSIQLVAGIGVENDAHSGRTVKHRSRVAKDPTQPNLRQVHLIHAELYDELRVAGFEVLPGEMGENITTRGLEMLRLPTGTRLKIGQSAVVEVTGLRNPCHQINHFQPGLMAAVLEQDSQGNLVRKAGVMGIVLVSGEVKVSDTIRVELPEEPHNPLVPV